MKNKHAVALGKKGGKKRAKNMSPKSRSESAKKAALARWKEEEGPNLAPEIRSWCMPPHAFGDADIKARSAFELYWVLQKEQVGPDNYRDAHLAGFLACYRWMRGPQQMALPSPGGRKSKK